MHFHHLMPIRIHRPLSVLLMPFAGLLFLAAPAFPATGVLAQGLTPQLIIKGVYAAYVKGDGKSPAYTPAVTSRLTRHLLEADFLIDGQDFQVARVAVRQVSLAGDKAVVNARFTNFGKPIHVRFDFRRIGDRWLVAEVRHLHDKARFSLRRMLSLRPL